MKNIRCNICNQENELNTHYCKNCGKNISNIIEKTDVLFFFCGFIKFIGIYIGVCCSRILCFRDNMFV